MYLTDFINWLSTHKPILAYLGAGSIIIFFLSIAALPILSGLIPSDYFCSPNRPSRLEKMPWWLGLPAILVKNFLGVLLILAGIIMLFIPGQGLVTILAGLVLTNFPGKYRL